MRYSRQRYFVLAIWATLGFGLRVPHAQASTFHVSPFGSDTAPYSTYQTAANYPREAFALAAQLGDTVLIHAGQYDTDTAMQVASGVAVVGISRDSVELTFCCLTNIIPRHILNLLGDNIITGIRFQHAYLAVNQPVDGILTSIPEGHILIDSCSFFQLGIVGTATDTMEIRNNYFEPGGGWGVGTQAGAGVVWVHDNMFQGVKGVSGPDCVVASSTNTIVEQNVFDLRETNFRGVSVSADESIRGMIIRNNLMMGGDLAIAWTLRIGTIENNTIIRTDPSFGGTIEIINGPGYDVTVRNNVLVDSPTPYATGCSSCFPQPQVHWFHNAYWPPTASFIDLGSGGSGVVLVDSANFNAFPMFADDTLYHLQAGSPLIDAGDPAVLDADGSRSDIGWTGGPNGITTVYPGLPPGAPDSISVEGTDGLVSISWSARPEADLAGYRLYRGSVSGFWSPDTPPLRELTTNETVVDDTILQEGQTVYYVVTAFDTASLESAPSDEAMYTITGVFDTTAGGGLLPHSPRILCVYPNPLNSSAICKVFIPGISGRVAHVRIELFDVLGRLVDTLVDDNLGAGVSAIAISATNASGSQLGSGVYFARLTMNDEGAQADVYKFVVLK